MRSSSCLVLLASAFPVGVTPGRDHGQVANEDSSNEPDSPASLDEEREAMPVSDWKTDPGALTLDYLIRMEESDDPAEQERAREIWHEQMGPAMEKLTSLSSGMLKRATGPLQEAVASQLRVGDLLKSTGLAEAMRPRFDIPQIEVPTFDTSYLDEIAEATAERFAQEERAAAASVETAETVRELVAVSQAQHEQLGAVTAVLVQLVEQGADAARSERRHFWAGVLVGAATLIVAAATLLFTWQMWLNAST